MLLVLFILGLLVLFFVLPSAAQGNLFTMLIGLVLFCLGPPGWLILGGWYLMRDE
jgi:hypothetical protein